MIFLHPAMMLFWLVMLFSIILTISTNSWLIAWLALEINLLVFIPMMITKNSKYQTEASLKYFLTQAMASVLILTSMYTMKNSEKLSATILIMALMLKTGAAPLHQWMISVTSGLKWPSIMILLIPQKIAPMILLSMFVQTNKTTIFYCFIVMSALIGSLGGLMTPSLKKIMAFSSISHLSWMLTSMMMSKFLWMIYFIIYSMIMMSLIYTMNMMKYKTLPQMFLTKKNMTKNTFVINMLSMAGLPPFSGFIIKMMVLMELTKTNLTLLMIFLLSATVISLFFYMRITISNMFNTNIKFFKPNKKMKENPFIIMMNLTGLLTFFPLLMI